ncbi:MAG: hypothetical protein H2172_02825 [Opitutus sp.]|nr:hypothetical protein [Opitutus sp.]MCS6277755.1 hypothetical protein [Opitutus sp.]MCS6299139.1 hypothetical protein [Opitutus sp.]
MRNKTISRIKQNEKKISGILLGISILFIWAWIFNLLKIHAWAVPLGYQGDAWFSFGIAKAYMDGIIDPFLFKFIPTLNAPFTASWNDYPITEDFIFAAIGWLGRIIGIFAAANLVLALAHVLAGLSFWFVCRELKYSPILSLAGGLAFAFCPYIFARGLGHITLTYAWHIPLLVMVSGWSYSKDCTVIYSRKFWLSAISAAACGVLNPYYTGMFIQLLIFSIIFHASRRNYKNAITPAIIIAISILAFLSMNANTMIFSRLNGANVQFAGRNLAALEVYGLKIPELLLPAGYHPWHWFMRFAQGNYYIPSYVKGELWSPFLGLVGIAAAALMVSVSLRHFFSGKIKLISVHFWHVLWILLYSLIGGVNLVIGVLGFSLFRATNRYSIFILVVVLLFLIRFLTKQCNRLWTAFFAVLIVAVALGEQYAPYRGPKTGVNTIEVEVNSDREFAQSIERQLPNSRVFQLPVAGFPEVGPINKMCDYEHFRPFLYTKTLHYSYGGERGRGDNDWQAETAKLPPSQMAEQLESMGFSVIMINKKGFLDSGETIIKNLTESGHSIIADSRDLIAIKLSPNSLIRLPMIAFGSGWSPDEGTHRWSEACRVPISLSTFDIKPTSYKINFSLSALTPRVIRVMLNGELMTTITIKSPGEVIAYETPITLKSGKTKLILETDAKAINPGNGDPRKLSIKLIGFKITAESK